MSNNHSHDNIYSILGKLEALKPTPEEKRFALVKEIRESVEAQGSILTGVDSVQQRLAEQFAAERDMGKHNNATTGFKALAKKAGGGEKGQRIAGAQFQKMKKAGQLEEATCNECGMYESKCSCTPTNEGETTHKDGVTTHRKTDFPGYPSDDLDDSEEDENKGKRGRPRKHAKKKETGEKRGRGRPSKHSTGEKSSKDKMPFSSTNKMGHDPFGRVKKDAEKTVAKKDSKKDSKKTVAENMDNLARRLTEGVNFANLLKEKHQTVDEMLAELSNDMKLFKETGHCSELLRDCMEIKGYHGKMMADEGSEQGIGQDLVTPQQRVAQATPPKPGVMNKVTDTLGGMKDWLTGKPENPTRPTYEEEDSLASELDELAKLAGLSEVSRGEYIKQQDTSAEKSGKNKFNAFGQIFNTDDVDEELEQEGTLFTKGLDDDDVAIGDKIPGTNAIKTKDIDTVDEAKVDVKDAPEAVNKPRPKFASIKTITTQGDDMNREKSQDPATANKAANPLTNKGSRVSEATLSLEAQLAAEYESIKKVS